MKTHEMSAVVLIVCVVYASEDCAAVPNDDSVASKYAELEADKDPIKCFECSTYENDRYCADPFNKTSEVKSALCHGSCAKWVRQPTFDGTHYIRTCSAKLNLRMSISLVCMQESRPGDGHLCFCHDDECNSAPRLHKTSCLPVLFLSFMTLLLTRRYYSGYFNVPRWWTKVTCDLGIFAIVYVHQRVIHPWRHRECGI